MYTIYKKSSEGKLLELMVLGKTVNLEASVSMLGLMLSQKIRDRIPLHLPPNILVANKTGELDDTRHMTLQL